MSATSSFLIDDEQVGGTIVVLTLTTPLTATVLADPASQSFGTTDLYRVALKK